MQILALVAAVTALLSPVSFQDQVTESATKTKFYKALTDMEIAGVAVRTRYWFAKVYAIALYTDAEAVKKQLGSNKATSDNLARAVVHSPGRRAFVLHFVREVSKDSIQGTFREGIEKSIKLTDSRIADDAKTFIESLTDIKKGDWVEMYFETDGTTRLRGNGEELVRIQNARLQQAILDIYLGAKPIDGKIKRNLVKFF